MDQSFWNLFWTTGMPEAWLMSRDRRGGPQAGDGVPAGERELLSGPLAGAQPRSENPPGGPMGLY